MNSISTLLRRGQESLSDSESPLIDAQILLCNTLNVDRSYLYMSPERELSTSEEAHFTKLINQRQQGVPIAHLTGEREFWSLKLKVSEHTLIPRPETEHLVEAALSIIQVGQTNKILDLGTGTGAIAIAIASETSKKLPNCQITATDISQQALTIAEENVSLSGLRNVRLKKGRWFEAVKTEKFDLVVSNPPYITEEHACLTEGDVRFEPRQALTSGHDGLDDIREIIQSVPAHINPNGWIMFEHGYDQKKAIQALLKETGFQNIETIQDYANLDRVSFGQWP